MNFPRFIVFHRVSSTSRESAARERTNRFHDPITRNDTKCILLWCARIHRDKGEVNGNGLRACVRSNNYSSYRTRPMNAVLTLACWLLAIEIASSTQGRWRNFRVISKNHFCRQTRLKRHSLFSLQHNISTSDELCDVEIGEEKGQFSIDKRTAPQSIFRTKFDIFR